MDRPEPKKVVLSIRCTEAEAELIRDEAQRTHRTISGLMVHATMEHIHFNRPRQGPFTPSGIRNKPQEDVG